MKRVRLVEGTSKRRFLWERKPKGEKDGFAYVNPELKLSNFGRSFFRTNPSIIVDFLRRPTLDFGEVFKSQKGVFIRRLPKEVSGLTGSAYYQVRFKGKSFFVKEIVRGKTGNLFDTELDLPSAQVRAIKQANLVLSAIRGFEDFEVVNWHLAFVGKNKAYFVTDWHGISHGPKVGSKKWDKDSVRIDSLSKHMRKSQVYDVLRKNIIYNKRTKKYVIIDPRYDSFGSVLD
jgi:hypothetical protein